MTVMTPEAKSLRINVLKRQRSAIDAEIVRLGGDVTGNPMWECHQCGHRWAGMTPLPPKQCPKNGCRSAYWDRPKSQTRADRAMGQGTEVPRVPMETITQTPRRRVVIPPTRPDESFVVTDIGLPPDLPPPPVPTRTPSLSEQLAERAEQPTIDAAIVAYENGVGRDHAAAGTESNVVETVIEQGDGHPIEEGVYVDPDEPDANDTADEADADGRTH